MLRWLTIEKFSAESGYTPDAVRSKIKRGDWLEGHVWIKAPDGRILIDTEGYEIISGERRWRAAKLVGLLTVPVVVREKVPDDQMLELALIENVQRQELNAIERAQGYRQMMVELGLTQEAVAQKVGLKRATVTNHLRLLELPAQIQEALGRGLISMGHARALLGHPHPDQLAGVVERVVRAGLSVRQLEVLVRSASQVAASTKAPSTFAQRCARISLSQTALSLCKTMDLSTVPPKH